MSKLKKVAILFIFLGLIIVLKNSNEVKAATYRWPISDSNASETYIEYKFGKRTYSVNNKKWPNEQNYAKTESHYGVDITGINGKTYTIVSVANGKVIATSADRAYSASLNFIDRNKRKSSNDGGGYGNYVVIQEESTGKCFLYAHLKAGTVKVKKGDTVKVGTELAKMGSSGDSGHMHLHFEVRKSKSTTLNQMSNGKHTLVKTSNSTNENPEKYIGSSPTTAKNNDPTKNLASEGKIKKLGDLNANGKIDSDDALICLGLYAKQSAGIKIKDYAKKYADYDKDGKLTVSDAYAILKTYSKNSTK